MSRWVCGWCLEGRHRSCCHTRGCGCAGQVEVDCQCDVLGHPRRIIDLRDHVLEAQRNGARR